MLLGRAVFVALASLFVISGCAAIAGVRDDLELVAEEGGVSPSVDGGAPSEEDATTGVDASDSAADTDTGPACREGETVCSGACVDLQTDARHCGACGAPCGSSRVCVEGSCKQGGRDGGSW